MEGSLLGLGYHSAASQQQQQQQHHAPEASSVQQPSLASDSADALMKQYLQQCLEYHEEQQALRDESNVEQLQFVPATSQQSHPTEQQSDAEALSKEAVKETTRAAEKDIDIKIEEARLRAQAILQRFQQQQQELLLNPSVTVTDGESRERSLYREQRIRAFQREEDRKRRALLKNLDYLARKQTQKLEQVSAQAEQSEQHYKATLEERKRANLQSQAGIGSKKRQRVERQRQATGHVLPTEDASVAVYLSGLPIDGSVGEDFLRQLFGSYGKIRKVHLYRNRETAELKGDGLVIFELSHKSEQDELLDAVCSQMNGAELPCGSVLQVEPANSSYGGQKKDQVASHYGPSTSTTCISSFPEKTENEKAFEASKIDAEKTEDEDLDDFFASL